MDAQTAGPGRGLLAVIAGAAALAAGLGIGRFAFALVNPAMTAQGWYTPGEAAAAGSADLIGYLVGVVIAGRFGRQVPAPVLVAAATFFVALTYAALAVPGPALALAAVRFLAGAAAAFVMIAAPGAALSAVQPARRAMVGGLMFAGVGLGILAAGVVVPVAAAAGGPAAAVLTLSGLIALGALVTLGLPRAALAGEAADGAAPRWTPVLVATAIAYGGAGFAFVPHTVFWGDYVARALGQGLAGGGIGLAAIGVGAATGPVLVGLIARRFSVAMALRVTVAAAGLSLLLPLVSTAKPVLVAVAVIAGMAGPGAASLASTRVMELVGGASHRRFWAAMTLVYAGTYAGGAQLLAFLFGRGVAHETLFVISAAGALLALGVEMAVNLRRRT